ncbi:hypothetical protein BTO20_11370 [Mycobacterium dioxanotrophicus]|uniref:Uncharacterized protein n=1 Tax=Mycobacterium dioxanotrophicus TaxID=482462 RepID=A0A1Y0C1U7_9MYCO|nr:DUF2742 domain-containing protein [Mycobacterium dioxanotrophicus]ART69104.1 hypothetical protein BTO20_11370 [Mycobacterium dioxanotrophicus]
MTDQATTRDKLETRTDSHGAGSPASQQVSWWPVHQFLESVVAQANYGPLPIAGTPAWQQLADGDPRKLLAVAMSGEHWVLRRADFFAVNPCPGADGGVGG